MNAFLQSLLHNLGAGIVQHWVIMLVPFVAVYLFVKYGSAQLKPSSIYNLLVFFQLVNTLVLVELWMGFTAFDSNAITTPVGELFHHSMLARVFTGMGALYCLMGLVYMIQWIRLEISTRKTTRNLPLAGTWIQQFTKHSSRELGIRRAVTVYSHPNLTVPFTTGFFRPIIVLPMQCISVMNGVQLQAIVLHELVHIYRNDYLVNKLLLACQRLVFFNPITHWVHQRIDEYRELAVDEKVVAHTHNKVPYAEALYLIGQWAQNKTFALQPAATGAQKSYLKHRIQQIISGNSYQNSPTAKVLAGLLILVCFGVLSLVQTNTTKPLVTTATSNFVAVIPTKASINVVENRAITASIVTNKKTANKIKTRRKLLTKAPVEYVESSFPSYEVYPAANYPPVLPEPVEAEAPVGKTIISIQRNALIDSLKVPQNIIFEIGKDKLKRARL